MPTPPLVLGDDGRLVFLAVRRKHPDWKASAFARWLGVEKSYVSEIETGRRDLPLSVARLLAEYVNDWDVVFGDALARGGFGLQALDEDVGDLEEIAGAWRTVKGGGSL